MDSKISNAIALKYPPVALMWSEQKPENIIQSKLAVYFFPLCFNRLFISWPCSNARNEAVTARNFRFRQWLVVRSIPHELAPGHRARLVPGSIHCPSDRIACIEGAPKRHSPLAISSPGCTRWGRPAV